MKLRLGKKPVKHDNRNLKLSNYLVKDELPRLYEHERWGQKIKYWRMMKNDVLQTCGIAAPAHAIMLWTSDNDSNGIPAFVSNRDVIKAYIDVTGMSGAFYNPKTGENDNGVYMLDALNYWRKTGIGKHKINAFVEINKNNLDHVKYAVRLFGQAYVGLQLPWSAAEQYHDGIYWSVPPTGDKGDGVPGSWGGHAVVIVGYDKDGFSIVTWGKLWHISYKFLEFYCDEIYTELSPDWFKKDKAPNGFDIKKLEKDLQVLKK